MRITITSRNMDLTSGLKDFTEKRIEKIRSHFDHLIHAHVILGFESKNRHKAEATIRGNSIRIHGKSTTGDMYSAIDDAMTKIERQLQKHKERLTDHHAKEAIELSHQDGSIDLPNTMIDKEDCRIHFVTKQIDNKPMTPEEAIMQLDLMGDNFFVFSNTVTDQINVVYHTANGQYGLIEKAT